MLLFLSKCRYFLRAIGLDAIPTVSTRRNKVCVEEKKHVINDSFWITLSRCAIHLLPIFASATLVYFNLSGYFIGFELAGLPGLTNIDLALMQLAAKVQELLVVASLASIIFHYVRRIIMYGGGLPVGYLGSGFAFSSLSWFWSPDFLAPAWNRENWAFVVFLAVCGLIASTAGPASAVLMLPRIVSNFPAGGTEYYIPGGASDLWPTQLGLQHYLPNTVNNTVDCSSGQGWTSALCPSGGYLSLWNHYRANAIWKYPEMSETLPFSGAGQGISVESAKNQLPPQMLQGAIRGWSSLETSTYGVHGATTLLQSRLNWDWNYAVQHYPSLFKQLGRYRYYLTQQSSVETQIPAVRVACSPGQITTADIAEVIFPYLPEFDYATTYYEDYALIPLDVLDLSSEPSEQQSKATILQANEQLGAVSAMLIYEGPWFQNNSRLVSGCSIDARWTKAVAWNTFPGSFRSRILHTRNVGYKHEDESFLPANDSTWQRISISPDWLNALNFFGSGNIDGIMGSNVSALEALFLAAGINGQVPDFGNDQGNPNSLAFLEHITATYFADAISRAGAFHAYPNPTTNSYEQEWMFFNQLPKYYDLLLTGGPALVTPSTTPSSEFTKLYMAQTITGYGYKASALTDYLSITVLLAHLLIALLHTAAQLYTRRSSGCWDTITELLVLAQQSEPASDALENTCAGIRMWETFRKKAWLRVAPGTGQHVELVFEGDKAKMGGNVRKEDIYGGKDSGELGWRKRRRKSF